MELYESAVEQKQDEIKNNIPDDTYKIAKVTSLFEDGIQVSYEAKLLNDIKGLMSLVEQRIYNLEVNVKDLERGQNLLEQSLAYINKYIVEKD